VQVEKPVSPSVMPPTEAVPEKMPETKAAAVDEQPKVSSTTELEKAYIADVNKESSKAADANPEPVTTEKKD